MIRVAYCCSCLSSDHSRRAATSRAVRAAGGGRTRCSRASRRASRRGCRSPRSTRKTCRRAGDLWEIYVRSLGDLLKGLPSSSGSEPAPPGAPPAVAGSVSAAGRCMRCPGTSAGPEPPPCLFVCAHACLCNTYTKQVLRYSYLQTYKPHMDTLDDQEFGPRVATVLLYLSGGGCDDERSSLQRS